MKGSIQPNHKKVIYFDMNNTLVDKDKSLEHSFKETLGMYFARWETENEVNLNKIWETYRSKWKDNAGGASVSKNNAKNLRKLCLKEALAPYPFPKEPAFLEAITQEIQAAQLEKVILFPGVKGIVEQLAAKYQLAILSNSPKSQITRQLEISGLSQWIPEPHIFTAGSGLPKKPNPKLFKHALKAMEVSANRAVMIGNTWKIDVYGATRSGMDAIWVHRYYKKKSSQRKIGREKVIIIRNFKQLADVFQLKE
jgi:FMN phosphatase YigB (HAD superfamily)